jgi:YD repeat-containing protein
MKRLIGRAAHARGVKERASILPNGRNWLARTSLTLLCAVAVTALAQENSTSLVASPPTPQIVAPPVAAAAVESTDPQTALKTVVEPKVERDPTSLAPFGDDFNPATGTITFSATDISIPGNFAIPVELRRWVPSDDADTGGPAGWTWNIPYIRGNLLDVKDGHISVGWNWGNTDTWRYGKNCTGSADIAVDNFAKTIDINSYWQGKLLHIPGVTSETFLKTAGGEQVTKSHFKIIDTLCIDNPPDAQGIVQQGIVVKGPDGTAYTFNQIKTYYNGKAAPTDPIVRTRLLMVSNIKDRFNNEVTYSYDGDSNLKSIVASDGRRIDIDYLNGEAIQASAHGRTWTYSASGVTLPDGRQWSYSGLSALAFKPNGIGGYSQQLRMTDGPMMLPSCSVAAGDFPVTIGSPDGLLSTYTFRDTIHYRSEVEPDLYQDTVQANYAISRALYCTITRSLVSKTSAGPGVGPYTWNYTYSGNKGTYTETSIPRVWLTGPFDLPAPVGGYPSPIAAGGAVNYRSVTVSGPDKRSVFYIDRKFKSISEERIIAEDTLNAAGTQLLERSESSFGLGALVGGHWYEGAHSPLNENQLTHHINKTEEKRKRPVNNLSDSTFTTEYQLFDGRGRPKRIIRTAQLGGAITAVQKTRTERMEYDFDNTALGVMGQLLSISADGISEPMVSHTYYSATALRSSTRKFGLLQGEYIYHADGNLQKHVDGLGYETIYTDYHRGQPQRIDRANGTFETAEVDDWGLLAARTDPNGYSWHYEYDNSLRLEKIIPPTGWTQTSIVYERATGAAYGLPTGHWRQTVDKGNARTVSYFDALWRPLMVRSYDVGNESNTRKVVVKTYDVDGQLIFESYPQRELATVSLNSPGRRMYSDALGRPTRLETDTETGVQVTTTEYVSNFGTRITNPRNKVTSLKFWARDNPDTAQLELVTSPEGVRVLITRNVLGNAISVQRWGTARAVTADVTRRYYYNANQLLCKTLEPEVIATVQGYDLAGNVKWRAPGVNLSATSCEAEASVPAAKKISYQYDLVNQLETVSYGDGSPGIVRSYWNDGLLKTIDSNGAAWSYGYSSLRKPTTEQLTYSGKIYNFSWNYDANGGLAGLTYPGGGPNPTYLPNAMGEPTQVGSYATNIGFHPNGAISGFSFGNNIAHSLTQTVEGTPKLNADGTVLKDLYTYDANGNVATIVDQRSAAPDGWFNRTMAYDDLDRLSSVTAPGVWNNATYLYDAADDLRSVTVGARSTTLTYGAVTKRLDSVITNGVTTAYGYDGNGNISAKGSQTYAFDLGNRMASASLGGSYSYDGHGRRTKIVSSDGTTQIQLYSQTGQLLWSEKTAAGTGTFPATAIYSVSVQPIHLPLQIWGGHTPVFKMEI